MTTQIDPGQLPGTTCTLLADDDGGPVRRTVLPGGLRVVTEAMPGVRSATVGIWVGVGSRDETPSLSGASHFLEHLLFKGTGQRTALDISVALDAVGGEMNAFTGKEYTCYHARVRGTDLPMAVDVLSDMVCNASLAGPDVESEREVILEEIAMNEDDPDDVVHNLITASIWRSAPLGRPIAGAPGSIRALSRTQIERYYRRRYMPPAMVVSAAGDVDHDTFVERVRVSFGGALADDSATPHVPRRGGRAPRFHRGVALTTRPTEQANVVLAVPGLPRGHDSRHALGVLSAAFGGGMSSRLFQEVRETRGLAYSVYSFAANYADAGMIGVYAGCAPGKVDDVLKVCRDQMTTLAGRGLSVDELERGKGQLRGAVVLGLEDPGSRMSRIGKADLMHGELDSIDEVLARIDAVTLDDVNAVAALLATPPTLAVVGPFDDTDRFDAVMR
ncbi:MAG: M16 family metallopeptidase [Nocardioidaceae bacterium]